MNSRTRARSSSSVRDFATCLPMASLPARLFSTPRNSGQAALVVYDAHYMYGTHHMNNGLGADMPATRRSGLIVAVLAGAGIVVSLMQTLLVPILPELPSLLHTTEANASWAVTATLL